MKSTALAGLSAALLSAGSAQAAMEVANIAASDNRFGTIALLAVPVLGVSASEGRCHVSPGRAAPRGQCSHSPPPSPSHLFCSGSGSIFWAQ